MTTNKNRYSDVPINVISKHTNEDCSTIIMKKAYEIILNSKANVS
jgi:hypothetical protein